MDGSADGKSESREHSDTNTQVAGVDEADIVKTDGERLYLVHGTELFVLDVLTSAAPWGYETFWNDGGDLVLGFAAVWLLNEILLPFVAGPLSEPAWGEPAWSEDPEGNG